MKPQPTLANLWYGLNVRANAARRRGEPVVITFRESMALHDALVGSDVPYQPMDRLFGVPLTVLEPEDATYE